MDVREKLLNAASTWRQNSSKRTGNAAAFYETLSQREASPELKKKFLLRLAVALLSYGCSAPRTEYLLEKAAGRLNIQLHIAILSGAAAISFPNTDESHQETHILTIDSGLDLDKLDRADLLANKIGEDGCGVVLGHLKLRQIASSPPLYGFWIQQLSYASLAATACLLFFNGSLFDAAVAFVMGLLIGLLTVVASHNMVIGQVAEFLGAAVVAFGARALATSFPHLFCYYPITLASLVWMLPGLSLTVGVSELVARSLVSGSARITYALFLALQLGFGMAVGEKLVFWDKTELPGTCPNPGFGGWWQILWFFGYSFASNVLLSARLEQWPGMITVSAFAWLTATFSSQLGDDPSSVISAFVIGVTGSLYSKLSDHLPMAMKTAAILLLVPGGLGVKGVKAILSSDVVSGMSFMFDMLIVGLSITVGLLLAKIVFPEGLFGPAKKAMINNKSSLAKQLEEEVDEWLPNDRYDEEEQESMAL